MVAHLLWEQGVAGSNPVIPNFIGGLMYNIIIFLILILAAFILGYFCGKKDFEYVLNSFKTDNERLIKENNELSDIIKSIKGE